MSKPIIAKTLLGVVAAGSLGMTLARPKGGNPPAIHLLNGHV